MLTSKTYDNALQQFKLFTQNMISHCLEFTSYVRFNEHLNTFYQKYLLNKKEYADLWKIIKLIIFLSHRQASVKRGFSVNKENLSRKTEIKKTKVEKDNGNIKKRSICICSTGWNKIDFTLLTKSNTYNKQHIEIQKQVNILDQEISDLKKGLIC